MALDVGDGVAYGSDLLCIAVGDSDAELFLKLPDELYCVKGVCAQVLAELCVGRYLVLVYCQFVDDDIFHSGCNIRHVRMFLCVNNLFPIVQAAK